MSNASQRLVDTLDAIGSQPNGMTVTDLARELDVSKATASRMLASFVDAGIVNRIDGQRHVLDLRLWSWGVQAAAQVRWIAEIARPMVIDAVRTSGVQVNVCVAHRGQTIFLEVAAPARGGVVALPCPTTFPLYACAPGKAMLAHMTEAQLAEVLDGSLERFTEHTTPSVDALQAELAEIRERGYALNRGEFWEDTVAVAAPVFDATNTAVAAVGSSGPRATLDVEDLERIAPVLMGLSESISAALGHMPAAYAVG